MWISTKVLISSFFLALISLFAGIVVLFVSPLRHLQAGQAPDMYDVRVAFYGPAIALGIILIGVLVATASYLIRLSRQNPSLDISHKDNTKAFFVLVLSILMLGLLTVYVLNLF